MTASADYGVCLVDRSGRIVAWNDALEVLLDCPASRAKGRWLNVAVPALGSTPVPRAVQDVLATRTVRTLARVSLKVRGRAHVMTVTIVPDVNGATAIWADSTERAAEEATHRRIAETFALAGASEALWSLDTASGQLQVSTRWRELFGLPTDDADTTLDAWLARVHDDDREGLRGAIDALVTGAIPHLVHEHRISRDAGVWRHVRVRGVAARPSDGRATRVAGSLADVTETTLALEQIKDADAHDTLTGALSRAAFIERIDARLEQLRAKPGNRFAIITLDIDRFKVVNDSLGHDVGNELLVAVARRLESSLRPGDAIARTSGDEFAVLLAAIGDEMQANVVGFRLQEALKTPFVVGGRDVVASASLGIAIGRADYAGAEELMRDADTAMHHAKSRGKGRHELFDAAMHVRAQDRLGLESDLRDAVNSSGFEVHFQPIVSLGTRRCVGVESLVRWNRHGKAVSPADFIPMAEELGIIEPLGTWVMQQACRKYVEWKAKYPESGLDFITVNVSARQIVQQGFIYMVEQTVEQNHMSPSDLRLEITETALMDAPQFAAQVLAELRQYGVKIYLDDFGTGYSSLSHLHKLPVDALKIDRSFVRGLLMPDRPAIVESILALARTLNTSVIAEGIEDERQAIELERLGCRHAQGYYFSKPIPAEQIEELLATNRTLGAMRVPIPPARATLLKSVKREIA
ncbi:MAG: EAL domain-containing protein [Vicinamibacterales bacterium]